MLVIAAHAQMHGNSLAFQQNLDGSGGQPHINLRPHEAVRHRVIMRTGLDMIVDPDTADPPFAIFVGLGRQGFERWTINLLQQLPTCLPKPPQGALFIQPVQQCANRDIDLGQRIEGVMA